MLEEWRNMKSNIIERRDGKGAADSATNNITSVIQTVLAAQLVTRTGLVEPAGNGVPAPNATLPPAPAPVARK